MAIYRLDLAYDGSGFRGYARQEGQRTVQGELEQALATLLKGSVPTSVAGRTDAGVHALGQVVSFPYDETIDAFRFKRSLNGLIGPEVSVSRVSEVPDGFSARFSAKWRRYRYLIDQSEAINPLSRGYVWHVKQELDSDAMGQVGVGFIGEHDFTSFCKSVEGKSNVRRVTELTLTTTGPEIELTIEANAFCHQMVRSVVGYLYDVGRGFSKASASEVIEARDRAAVATVAPPHGLTLMAVGYD